MPGSISAAFSHAALVDTAFDPSRGQGPAEQRDARQPTQRQEAKAAP